MGWDPDNGIFRHPLLRQGAHFIGNVEVLSQSSSMMRADKVFNDFRQIMFLGKLQAICDMADDNLRTLFIVEAFMRIYSRLVLGEEGGVYHLPISW